MVAPPEIALTDLDRDELLRLLSGRLMAFTADDLWRIRWDTLSERAAVARGRASDALGAYLAGMPELASGRSGRVTRRQLIRDLEADEARKTAWKRAQAAEERAWRALEACDRRMVVA